MCVCVVGDEENCCGLTTTTTTSNTVSHTINTNTLHKYMKMFVINTMRSTMSMGIVRPFSRFSFIYTSIIVFFGLDYDNLKCCHRTIIQPLYTRCYSFFFIYTHIDYHAYLFPLFSVSFNYIFLYLTFLSCLYRSSRLSFFFLFGLFFLGFVQTI